MASEPPANPPGVSIIRLASQFLNDLGMIFSRENRMRHRDPEMRHVEIFDE